MKAVYGEDLYPYLPQILNLLQGKIAGFSIEGLAYSQAIAVLKDKEIVAVVIYGHYNGCDIHMSVASTHPSWCSKKILELLFSYPFLQLGVKRVTAITSENNHHTVKFLKKLGFIQEGRHPQAMPDGSDSLSFGLMKKNCRFIHE